MIFYDLMQAWNIRIKRYLFCWRKKHQKLGNIAVLFIYLSIYLLILRNCIIFPLNDYILSKGGMLTQEKNLGT